MRRMGAAAKRPPIPAGRAALTDEAEMSQTEPKRLTEMVSCAG